MAPASKPKPAPQRAGFGHTTLQVKCHGCLRDIAAGGPGVSRLAKVIRYEAGKAQDYLCVKHAMELGYAGRLAAKEKGARGR